MQTDQARRRRTWRGLTPAVGTQPSARNRGKAGGRNLLTFVRCVSALQLCGSTWVAVDVCGRLNERLNRAISCNLAPEVGAHEIRIRNHAYSAEVKSVSVPASSMWSSFPRSARRNNRSIASGAPR